MIKRTNRFDDGSFVVVEDSLTPDSSFTTVNFGPLSTTLGNLFEGGFRLAVYGWETSDGGMPYLRKHKIHLENLHTKERYVIAKGDLGDILSDRYSLSDFITHGVQMIRRGAGREIVKEVTMEIGDPWETLRDRHPAPPNPKIMIGNMTLSEAVHLALNPIKEDHHAR